MSICIATFCRSLSLFLSLIAFVHGQTCYISAGVAAASSIVPCGTGTAACCQLGDTCLEDSACFNEASGVTYLYGCSDASYTNAVCPWKCGPDYDTAPYVGLVYCKNVTSNIWSCTHPPDSSAAIQVNPPQQCYADSEIAFTAGASINPILLLPSTSGGTTEYYSDLGTTYSLVPGYTPDPIPTVIASKPTAVQLVIPASTTTKAPSTTPSRTTTTSVRPTTSARPTTTSARPIRSSVIPKISSVVSQTTPTAIIPSSYSATTSRFSLSFPSSSSPTTTPQSSTLSTSSTTHSGSSAASSSGTAVASSGLSSGAKAGIGGGVAGGVFVLAAIGLLVFCLRRRRRSHEPVPQNEVPYSPTEPMQQRYTDPSPGIPPAMGTVGRSELAGDVPNRYSAKHGSQSELGSYSRFESPAPTYSSWGGSPNPGGYSPAPEHDGIHEIGTHF